MKYFTTEVDMDWFLGKGVDGFFQQYSGDIKELYLYCKFINLISFESFFLIIISGMLIDMLIGSYKAREGKRLKAMYWLDKRLKISKSQGIKAIKATTIVIDILCLALVIFTYCSIRKIADYSHDHPIITSGLIKYSEVTKSYKDIENMRLGAVSSFVDANKEVKPTNFKNMLALAYTGYYYEDDLQKALPIRFLDDKKFENDPKSIRGFSLLLVLLYLISLSIILKAAILVIILGYHLTYYDDTAEAQHS